MTAFLVALLIIGMVALYALTFVVKSENHVFYRVLGKLWKWYLIIGLLLTVVYYCSQSMGRSSHSYEERQYRGRF